MRFTVYCISWLSLVELTQIEPASVDQLSWFGLIWKSAWLS
jgi:hypothetical protein